VGDLFAAVNPAAPLAERLRPQRIEEVIGQSHLLAPGMPRGEWWDARRLPPGLPPRRLDDLADVEVDRDAGRYQVWFFDLGPDRVIWGLTARVLKELLDRALRPAP